MLMMEGTEENGVADEWAEMMSEVYEHLLLANVALDMAELS